VDGKWFYLDAAQDINIPSASPGTVRIDRIVLRCLWSGFNVSAYVLTGTTTPPALTPQTRRHGVDDLLLSGQRDGRRGGDAHG